MPQPSWNGQCKAELSTGFSKQSPKPQSYPCSGVCYAKSKELQASARWSAPAWLSLGLVPQVLACGKCCSLLSSPRLIFLSWCSRGLCLPILLSRLLSNHCLLPLLAHCWSCHKGVMQSCLGLTVPVPMATHSFLCST